MGRLLIIATAAALAAGPASAQSTVCHPINAGKPELGVTCTSTGGFSSAPAQPARAALAPPVVYSWKDVKPSPCSKFETLTQGNGNYCEARLAATARKGVGELIAGGKCDEALKAALGTGDLDFAREVRDFCSASR